MSTIELLSSVILASILVVIVILISKTSLRLLLVLYLSYVSRITFVFVESVMNIFPYQRDYPLFRNRIQEIISSWGNYNIFPEHMSLLSINLYSFVVSPLYYVTGSLLGVATINALFGTIIVYNIYRISNNIFKNYKYSIVSAVTAAIYPSLTYYTSIPMRDSLSIVAMTFFLYYITKSDKHDSLFATLASAIVAIAIRPENAVVICTILAAYVVFSRGTKKLADLLLTFGLILPVIIIGIYLFTGEMSNISLDALTAQRQYLGRAITEGGKEFGGRYLENIRYSSWVDLLLYLPLTSVYFLGVPFPWNTNFSNPFQIVALLENLFFFFPILILAIRAFISRKYTNLKGEKLLLMFLLVGAMSYGLLESNMGPAMRHRLQFTVVIPILASPVISRYVGFVR